VVDAKLGDFFEVASALMEIKGKALFRETHRNFHLYCQEHWGFGRSYANKLIGSAERIQLLPEDLPKPANEFQIRPFLKLEPEEFPKKWQTILDAAGAGKVTSRIVEETLQLPKRKRKKRKSKSSDQRDKVNEILENLRAALKERKVEDAMNELAKLEKLLKV
jgi:chromatin segregation and condensation protein Rec8/ScpA/Scc1 (kleisin family)